MHFFREGDSYQEIRSGIASNINVESEKVIANNSESRNKEMKKRKEDLRKRRKELMKKKKELLKISKDVLHLLSYFSNDLLDTLN